MKIVVGKWYYFNSGGSSPIPTYEGIIFAESYNPISGTLKGECYEYFMGKARCFRAYQSGANTIEQWVTKELSKKEVSQWKAKIILDTL